MAVPSGHRQYRFGDCVLDLRRGRLVRAGTPVRLRPKSFAVLTHLVENPGRLITKQELLEEVWGDTCVTEDSVSQCLIDVRRAIGDSRRELIRTVPRRGFTLEVAVSLVAPEADSGGVDPRDLTPGTGRVERASRATHGGIPVIAVLPFDSLSDDADLQYFADGVSEEILQAVARTRGARVIGRSSSFQFRGRGKSVLHVASELRCTHVLDGSVRRSGSRIRVSAQLTSAADQITLWSDRFERRIVDIFDLQDEIASAVAGALQVAFASAPAGPIDPRAYDLYLRSKAASTQWLGAGDPELLEQALVITPDFAPAWAALAVTLAVDASMARDAGEILVLRSRALEAAQRALEQDRTAGLAHVAMSILQPICGHFDERDRYIERALAVAPNDPVVRFWACRWRQSVGQLREAFEHSNVLKDLDPLWPQGVHQHASMIWAMGRRDEAKALWDWSTGRWPGLYYLYAAQIGFALACGDRLRAEEVMAAMRKALGDSANTKWASRIIRDMHGPKSDVVRRLRTRVSDAMAEFRNLPLHLHVACNYGLTDDVYHAVARSDYSQLFAPTGRLHPEDFGLHILFLDSCSGFRRDVRFVDFCTRLGLSDYWLSSNRWPDCADEVVAHYDFQDLVRRAVAR